MKIFGFIGLGKMGAAMAANLSASGIALCVYDAAGTAERAPPSAIAAESVQAVALESETIFLSLPDARAVHEVCHRIAHTPSRRTSTVVDLSTIGITGAREIAEHLREDGLEFIDAPVSGGVAGAVAARLTVMFAGATTTFEALSSPLSAIATNIFHVGHKPGQGQALKLANNFLSATAMAATSEALSLGLAHGLQMQTMLDVLNVSTGRNTATADKFPRQVLTGAYDVGFSNTQTLKDCRLYLEASRSSDTVHRVSESVTALWEAFCEHEAEADQARVFPFINEKLLGSSG